VNDESYPKIYLYRRIVQSKLFIDEHYAGTMELDRIAGEACFSKFHFIRLFKKLYGKTPHQYLSFVRIEKAKLLLTERLSITEVCFSVGFDSVASFTGLFKRTVGKTPSAYQAEQHQHRADTIAMPLRHVPYCFAEKISYEKSNFREATT
jgi:AraC-like DNA-binding protein